MQRYYSMSDFCKSSMAKSYINSLSTQDSPVLTGTEPKERGAVPFAVRGDLANSAAMAQI